MSSASCAAVAVVLALGLAACSSDDGADVRSSGAVRAPAPARVVRARAPEVRAPACPQGDIAGTSDNPLVQQAVEDYDAYVERRDRPAARRREGLHRRGAGRRPRGRQGGLRPLPGQLGAHRADRRSGRGDRRRGRRPGRRLRERAGPGVHRLAPDRVHPLGAEHDRGRRRVRRPARRGSRHAEDRHRRTSRSRRWRSPRARPSSSKRCRRARSPARRIGTRTPTSGTSPPTSRAPRRPSS